MKQLPEINASFENMHGTLIAPIRSELLLAGIKLGVFNHLSEPTTAETVAEALKSHPANTRFFLDGLAACDLVTKKDEGLTHERTKPDAMVLSMTHLALMGQDMRFDQGEIADSMLRVGFRSVRSRMLDMDWGPMDLDIGRKA